MNDKEDKIKKNEKNITSLSLSLIHVLTLASGDPCAAVVVTVVVPVVVAAAGGVAVVVAAGGVLLVVVMASAVVSARRCMVSASWCVRCQSASRWAREHRPCRCFPAACTSTRQDDTTLW